MERFGATNECRRQVIAIRPQHKKCEFHTMFHIDIHTYTTPCSRLDMYNTTIKLDRAQQQQPDGDDDGGKNFRFSSYTYTRYIFYLLM